MVILPPAENNREGGPQVGPKPETNIMNYLPDYPSEPGNVMICLKIRGGTEEIRGQTLIVPTGGVGAF